MEQVVKSVTESTTVLNSETLPPTSSVASVAMPVTWLAIVLTAREAAIGATMAASTVAVGLLAAVMLLTGRWRYVHTVLGSFFF